MVDHVINLREMLNNILTRENIDKREINIDFSDSTLLVNSNKFALETVFSNLINNAIFYSPNNTAIEIAVSKTSERKVLIKISNICHEETQENDLKLFFDPLWQKDSSRTSTERFGLGLATISASLINRRITFTVSL